MIDTMDHLAAVSEPLQFLTAAADAETAAMEQENYIQKQQQSEQQRYIGNSRQQSSNNYNKDDRGRRQMTTMTTMVLKTEKRLQDRGSQGLRHQEGERLQEKD